LFLFAVICFTLILLGFDSCIYFVLFFSLLLLGGWLSEL